MARSAKRARKPAISERVLSTALALGSSVGGVIARNPTPVAGTTAFLVALSFVSANALWYQPHFHANAFFATRNLDTNYVAPALRTNAATDTRAQTTIRFERPAELVPQVRPDPVLEQVQGILRDLGFYTGTVDGLNGPATREAILNYRKKVGLPAVETIDDELLTQLGTRPTTSGIAPTPAAVVQASAPTNPDVLVTKVQAGLKAFGNDGIEIDGVVGSRTRNAIREFQSLFDLPVTGEPDEQLYFKMREIGLTG
ncbi:peptidoglycan-binding protein [Mesorhizobium sp. NBSH29]|uniref:peptidoglycan-binding domain-containing protein n=1 Tax=Mesorhizobium sp. NBSH29 TaxID=2654249 RepID=UPI001896511F|nr:peptidoglycan-binding protein [Mesorhizobium sp. NBSH29]QPC87189.1 peptidoglycan-binding protein [Mesorhizobium sp. NBSH29]